jgi:hypothetical protein
VTPFEAFFGQKPHLLVESLLNVDNELVDEDGNVLPQPEHDSDSNSNSNSDSDSDLEYLETDIEDAEYILTELERLIRQSNAWTAARMVKKASGKAKVYTKDSIVSLAIPLKLRLRTEAKRILCRITKVVKNQYTLICIAGPLKGTHSTGQLNGVLALDESLVPLDFPRNKAKLSITKVRALFINISLN